MNELILEWQEVGRKQTQKIYEQQPSKNPGTVRIGRDPVRCDIVLTHPTVSGLHVEIFFHPQQRRFYLRNLRVGNSPIVDGQRLQQGEIALRANSTIYLGEMVLKVVAISAGIPPTVVVQHHVHPPTGQHQSNRSTQLSPTPVNPAISRTPTRPTNGVQCTNPKCNRAWPETLRNSICPGCGTSLNAGLSVLISPGSN